MKKENVVGCLRIIVLGIKLKAHNLIVHYSLLGVLGKHKKLSGDIFIVLLFYLQFQYKCQDYNITNQAGETPYSFINMGKKEYDNNLLFWNLGLSAWMYWSTLRKWVAAVCLQRLTIAGLYVSRVKSPIFCISVVIPQTLHEEVPLCLWFSYPSSRWFSLKVSWF